MIEMGALSKAKLCLGLVAIGSAALGTGCGAATGSEESENLGVETQEVVLADWGGGGVTPHIVGMAINVHSVFFEWTDITAGGANFLGCFGAVNPCGNGGTAFAYSSAFTPAQIRGIGVSKTNGQVYTWASTPNINNGASFSKGFKENLGPAQPFTIQNGRSMSELIEVDQSSSGTWQFWWKVGNTVQRSLSSNPGLSGTMVAGNVQVLPNPIVGIAIDFGSPNNVWTFYGMNNLGQSPLNISSNAMDLAH